MNIAPVGPCRAAVALVATAALRLAVVLTLTVSLLTIAQRAAAEEVDTDALRAAMAEHAEEASAGANLRAEAYLQNAYEFGAAVGYNHRQKAISKVLRDNAEALDVVFDFRGIMLMDNEARLLAPPVVSSANREISVSPDGQTLRTVAVRYQVLKPQRFVIEPPTWRNYFVGVARPVAVPPLFTDHQIDRRKWNAAIEDGWRAGADHAMAVFTSGLAEMSRDRAGMIRFHLLLQAGLMRKPVVQNQYDAVTGNASDMAIEDAVVRVAVPASLELDPDKWEPIPQLPDLSFLTNRKVAR